MTRSDNLSFLLSQINAKSILDCTDKQVAKELAAMEYAPTCLLQPAGKRPRDFGLDDGWQGIIHADRINERRASVKVTYLAAGFVFGNKGQSIQDISEKAHVKTQSWCSQFSDGILGVPRELRVWHICGEPEAIHNAVKLISKAVERYRELIGGQYKDKVVPSQQEVCGIQFFYKPPPIHKMPNSARTVYFCEKPSDYGNQKAALKRTQSQSFNVANIGSSYLQKAIQKTKSIPVVPPEPPISQAPYVPQYLSWVPVYHNDYYPSYPTYMPPHSHAPHPVSMMPPPTVPYSVPYAGHMEAPPPLSFPSMMPNNTQDYYFAPQYIAPKYHYVR